VSEAERRAVAAGRAASATIWSRLAWEKRRCLASTVHGTSRRAARRRSHDSGTCNSSAAWVGVNNVRVGSPAGSPVDGPAPSAAPVPPSCPGAPGNGDAQDASDVMVAAKVGLPIGSVFRSVSGWTGLRADRRAVGRWPYETG
jgi:hypothetical protein